VLSDGEATSGSCLHTIVKMTTLDEVHVSGFCGMREPAVDDEGTVVAIEDIYGEELQLRTEHDVQIFFLGFGEAETDVGRILAQATGAEYQGNVEEDLAGVIEELNGYF